MSLFGLEQAGELFKAMRAGRPFKGVEQAFSTLTKAVEERLAFGAQSVREASFELPELVVELPLRVGVDEPQSPLSGGTRTLLRGSLKALQEMTETLRVAVNDGPTQIACRELGNKLEAFESFQYAYAFVDLEEVDSSLSARVVKAQELESFRGIWVMEGLGYGHAESAWSGQEPPQGLLTDPALDVLPAKSWIPLHTGMGLIFARRTFAASDPDELVDDSRQALERFIALCDSNCRPGYTGATCEALGLVVRNLHPHAVASVSRGLAELAPTYRSIFWHGMGRGLYFNLSQFLPGVSAMWRGVEKTRREPPDEEARLNALAGLAWALALVNIRHPKVLEGFLREHGEQLTDSEKSAFANGASSALTLWYDTVGEDSYFTSFRQHQVNPTVAGLDEMWESLVCKPCDRALERYQQLRQGEGLGRLFHL